MEPTSAEGGEPGKVTCSSSRRMILIAASCPSNNAVDVTNHTACSGTYRLLPFAEVATRHAPPPGSKLIPAAATTSRGRGRP